MNTIAAPRNLSGPIPPRPAPAGLHASHPRTPTRHVRCGDNGKRGIRGSPLPIVVWLVACVLWLPAGRLPAQVPPPNDPGYALSFDGVDDYLSATPPTLPVGNSAYTIEAWIKPNTMRVGGVVGWGNYGATSEVNAFDLTSSGLRNYWWANDLSVATPNLAGAWHHIAATFDGTTRRILLNGAVMGSDSPVGHNAVNSNFRIGSANIGSLTFFAGMIDEVRVWNVARSAAQIQESMRRQLFGNESGLVAYWRMDEGVGSSAFDATGNSAQTATLVNGPGWSPSGVGPFAQVPAPNDPGYALSFDGVDDWAAVPHDAGLNAYPLTISAWVKTTHNAALVDGIVSKYVDASYNGYSLYLYNGHVGGFYFKDVNNRVFTSLLGLDGGFVADGLWHHVALVVDAAGGRIVLDGDLRASLPWSGLSGTAVPGMPTTAEGLQIGRYFNYGNRFQGQIDEVRLWNVALTTSQIQESMRRQLFGNESGLVAYWRMDEGVGSSTFDATGNSAHTATLFNGPGWSPSGIRPFAPTALTLAPVIESAGNVTLNGAAMFNDAVSTGFFHWGLTTSYGNVTPAQVLTGVAGPNSSNAWSQTLTGLAPGVTYHYRAVATNIHGPSFGVDRTVRLAKIQMVSNTDDSGAGSLRQVLHEAGAGDTIRFAPGVTGAIRLTSGELGIDKTLAIEGPGANALTVFGGGLSRVFRITAPDVAIAGLSIADGKAAPTFNGGGIRVEALRAGITNCVFANNAAGTSPANGGGLAVMGASSATVHGCTFSGNQADGGGAIAVAGNGQLLAVQCTLALNRATLGSGGGLSTLGAATLVACTVVSNTAPAEGGTGGTYRNAGGSLVLRSCLVAANSGGNLPDVFSITSAGHNLIGVRSGSPLATDLTGIGGAPLDPLVGPLRDNGGSTPTMALLPGSPALESGEDALIDSLGLVIDQRDQPRRSGCHVDIGALETTLAACDPTLVLNLNGSGGGSLRQAAASAPAGSVIQFALGANPNGSIRLSGEIVIDKDLSIRGPGARWLTLDAQRAGRVFNISSGRVSISGLSFTGGLVQGGAGAPGPSPGWSGEPGNLACGGAILNRGELTLTDCLLWNCSVSGGRGGDAAIDGGAFPAGAGGAGGGAFGAAICNSNRLVLLNCTVYTNQSLGGSGGTGGEGFNFTIPQGGLGGNGGLAGGAVFNAGFLFATNCTFYTNRAVAGPGGSGGTADGRGGAGGNGGLARGGAILDLSTSAIVNCTLAGNVAIGNTGGAGGVGGTGTGASGSWVSGEGGGINRPGGPAAEGYVRNSLVAHNVADIARDCAGSFTSGGFNLVGTGSGGIATGFTRPMDLIGESGLPGIDARLAPFGYYGGQTPGLLLRVDSPAVDRGHSGGTTNDQRGLPRPVDEPNVAAVSGSDGADIGAFEREPADPLFAERTTAFAQGTINFSNSGLGPLKYQESAGEPVFNAPVGVVVGVFWGRTPERMYLVPSTTLVFQTPLGLVGLFNGGIAYPLIGPGTPDFPDAREGEVVFLKIAAWRNKDCPTTPALIADGPTTSGLTHYGESEVVLTLPLGPPAGPGTVVWQSVSGANLNRVHPFTVLPVDRPPSPSIVVNLNDDGVGSLRSALRGASRGDVIRFDPTLRGRIVLSSGELFLDQSLTIEGPGAGQLTVSGNNRSRTFHIGQCGDVTIRALTLMEGLAQGRDGSNQGSGWPAFGGGIYNEGTLRLVDCMMTTNRTQGGRGGDGQIPGPLVSAGQGGAAVGGAIYNAGSLTLHRCTALGNVARGGRGGDGGFSDSPELAGNGGTGAWGSGGAIFTVNPVTMVNCTFAGNMALGGDGGYPSLLREGLEGVAGSGNSGDGGAIFGPCVLESCTIVRNSATGGSSFDPQLAAGGRAGGVGGKGPIASTSRNSIIGLNTVSGAFTSAPDVADTTGFEVRIGWVSEGGNLIGNLDGSSGWIATDLVGNGASPLDPLVGPVRNNGGGVWTAALLPGSLALDHGLDAVANPSAGDATDARGFPRWSGAHVDIGAYEDVGTVEVVTTAAGSGVGSLGQAILNANATAGRGLIDLRPVAGMTLALTAPLPPITDALIIDGTVLGQSDGGGGFNPASASIPKPGVVLDGTAAGTGAHGLVIQSSNVSVRGLVVQNFSGHGILLSNASECVLAGNYIGTDVTGTIAQGNGGDGIRIVNGWSNSIGAPGTYQVSSGNRGYGLRIERGGMNVIPNDYFGPSRTRSIPLANQAGGVLVSNSPGNLFSIVDVSGNGGHGIHITGPLSSGNRLSDSYVMPFGYSLANRLDGIRIEDVPGDTVLDSVRASGNGGNGISILNAPGTELVRCLVGSSPFNTNVFPNGGDGIFVRNSARVRLGSSQPGLGNIIGPNGAHGIHITGTGSTGAIVAGNAIGTDFQGRLGLGNAGVGAAIVDAAQLQIGTSAGGGTNWIAYNAAGVTVSGAGATNNAIRYNSIYANTGLGIDLGADGVTANDAGDGDAGPNRRQNFPVLSVVTLGAGTVGIQGMLDSRPVTVYTLDFYANVACDASANGEGQTYLGSATATTDVGGHAEFNVALPRILQGGSYLSATAIDPDGNTSEFSPCHLAFVPPPVLSCGFARQELYFKIGGGYLPDLTNHARYPDAPDLVRYRTSLEANSADEFDNYGTRLSGYLIPPVTGDYRFYVAADDQGEFWLSTDANPARLEWVAREPLWADRRDWTGEAAGGGRGNPPANVSVPIPLVAGQMYFYQALMKEGGGPDHLAVAWQLPGAPVPPDGSSPIPGSALAVLADPVGATLGITRQPSDQHTCLSCACSSLNPVTNVGSVASFSVGAVASLPGDPNPPMFIQWQKSAGGAFTNVPGANASNLTFTPTVADHGSCYRALICIPGAVATSAVACLTVERSANTFFSDFNNGLPPGATLSYSELPGPVVVDGVLRLTEAVASQNNLFFLDPIGAGEPVASFVAKFRVRLADASPFGPADGFSLSFGPQVNGTPFTGEEGVEGALRVSFDTFDNGRGGPLFDVDASSIDVFFGGQRCGSVSMASERRNNDPPATPIPVDPALCQPMEIPTGNVWANVEIRLDADGTVDVWYKGVQVLANVPTGYVPTVGRFALGARTGGAWTTHEIDDLCVTVVPASVDSIRYCTDFNAGLPPGATISYSGLPPGPAVNNGVLQLTGATNDQNNLFFLAAIGGNQPVGSFIARFRVRLAEPSPFGPADGFSFSFGPQVNGTPFIGEEGVEGALRVSFDTWDNGTNAPFFDLDAPAIDVFHGSQRRGLVSMAGGRQNNHPPATPIPTDPATCQPMEIPTGNAWADVEIRLDSDGTVDVIYKGVKVLADVPTGYQPTVGRFALGARTGGAWTTHEFDDFCILLTPHRPEPTPVLSVRIGASNNGANTVILSWPNPSTGYILQQTANMSSPGGVWEDVTQPRVIVGLNQEVTLSATRQFCVFRLRKL